MVIIIIVTYRDDDDHCHVMMMISLDFQARCAPKLTSDIIQYLKDSCHHHVKL